MNNKPLLSHIYILYSATMFHLDTSKFDLHQQNHPFRQGMKLLDRSHSIHYVEDTQPNQVNTSGLYSM